jgi:hypothetical protein
MSEQRWKTGEPINRGLYRCGQYCGSIDSAELASEIVTVLNGEAPNDREGICSALSREANRIFQQQEKEYPSNVLDIVSWNLMSGETEALTIRKHPGGKGIVKPDREHCFACAKVLRHPGEGYVCAWHTNKETNGQ